MAANTNNRVLAIAPPKEAALFFTEVFPLDFALSGLAYVSHLSSIEPSAPHFDHRLQLPVADLELTADVLSSLLPSDVDHAKTYYKNYLNSTWLSIALILRNAHKNGEFEKEIEKWSDTDVRNIFKDGGVDFDEVVSEIRAGRYDIAKSFEAGTLSKISENLREIEFDKAPVWALPKEIKTEQSSESQSELAYALTLRDLNLVDPTSISWEKLIELRKDKESMVSLRKFRLLFDSEFKGRSKSEIEDRLYIALEEHRRIASAWKLDMIDRSFSFVASKPGLAASSLAAASGLLMGAPLAVAAASSAVAIVAGCAIECAKVYKENESAKFNSGFAYLSKLKELS